MSETNGLSERTIDVLVWIGVALFALCAWYGIKLENERKATRTTMTHLRHVGTAIELFLQEGDEFAKLPEGDLTRIAAQIGVDESAALDGWQRTLQVRADGRDYIIWSRGADGIRDQEWNVGPISDPSHDFIFCNGAFSNLPEGTSGASRRNANPECPFTHPRPAAQAEGSTEGAH